MVDKNVISNVQKFRKYKHSYHFVINFLCLLFLISLTCICVLMNTKDPVHGKPNLESSLHTNEKEEIRSRNKRSLDDVNENKEESKKLKIDNLYKNKKLILNSNENTDSNDILSKHDDINNFNDNKVKTPNNVDKYTKKNNVNSSSGAYEQIDKNFYKQGESEDMSGDSEDEFSEERRLEYHSLVANQLFAKNIEANLAYLSSKPHLAGTEENNAFGQWIKEKFKNYSLDNVFEKQYNVLLSYPRGTGNLTLFDVDGNEEQKINVIEKKLDWFENSTNHFLYPPFLAYSQSASAEGEMVYANFGEEDDFKALKEKGINVEGKIVLIRYGSISRNKKIKYAERYNVKGVILFSDPDTYSPTGVCYPDSWYLPPDGVQRGTLLRMRGDPLSRGYPAIKGLYQRPIKEVTYFPAVPVQPIGFGDAQKLLQTLDGENPPSAKWHGALNITYNITSKHGRKVRLDVNVTREKRDITNIIGVIKGAIEPDRFIILGNHRDAWTYGAADPSSGTAVMVEVARALGWLKQQGWRPRRTIMFCSWDAEEYGLLGSTEWTEEFAKILTHQAVAYINVDTAVQGNHTIELKSTPELIDTFFDAVKLFKDPDSEENLYDMWVRNHEKDQKDSRKEPTVKMFREGSDYMPFYADLGIPSMDFRYMFNTKDMGVFNFPTYHTMHDNIAWMKKFVDPDFRYHTTIAKVWTQVALLLADTVLLPFNFIRYSDSLRKRVRDMAKLTRDNGISKECDYSLLLDAVAKLSNATEEFHNRLKDLDKSDVLAVRIANDQMMMFERTFVTSEDIPGEPSTRHVYHTAGLSKALDAVIREKDKDWQNSKVLNEFKEKYSIYTYHVMMAVHSLKNPFTSFDVEKPIQNNDKTPTDINTSIFPEIYKDMES